MKAVSIFLLFLSVSVLSFSQSHIQTVDSLCKLAEQAMFVSPDSAFVYAQQGMLLAKEHQYEYGLATCHHLTGEVFFHQGFYKEALNNLLEADRIYKSGGHNLSIAENLNQLGLVYYNIRQPEVALEKHQQAMIIYESLNDKKGLAYTYGCIGRLQEKKKNYDAALAQQHRALKIYKELNDVRGIATILENVGSIYEDLLQYDTAHSYFKRALQLNEQVGDSLLMIVNLNNLADGYRKTGQHNEAVQLATQALNLALRLNDKYQVVSAYKDLSKIYYQSQDYRAAYENLEKGRTLYEEMYGEEGQRQVALVQTLFELERKNNEIQTLQASQRFNILIRFILFLGFALLALLAFVIISRQRLKIRQNKNIIERKEAEEKLMKVELENVKLHEKQLQHDLENQSKSLTAHTLHIISKNKILEDIREKLTEALQDDVRDQRKKIGALVKLIDHNFVQDKDWDDFRNIFEQVHQHFFDALQKVATDLTAADLRLAALIRLNLPSKDIATILGISQDSLRISRYRLRKKLKLVQGDSLTNFILAIG